MEFHRGRLLDHVQIHVSNVQRSKQFYREILKSLGLESALLEMGPYFAIDELFFDEEPTKVSKVHLAFQARDRDMVHAFYKAAIAAGGKDNGAPGERPQYHPGYYAAFVFDPDGNNLEAVYHGPSTRSADSVVIRPE